MRRSGLRSTRGHVRLEKRPIWAAVPRAVWAVGGVVALIVVFLIARQLVLPALDKATAPSTNSTWLDVEWTQQSEGNIRQLGERLKASKIALVYLESGVWFSDGSFREVQHAAEFARTLRDSTPDIKVLLWLREINLDKLTDPETRAGLLDLARRAVNEWGLDGVQLQGSQIENGSASYLQMLRDLRTAIGPDALLSVTVPADRIPTDPDVPVGLVDNANLTWDMDYKKSIGLLGVDEMVIMAHGSGLSSAKDYETWVAYQVESYASALGELSDPVRLLVALPTYGLAIGHDPAIEGLEAAVRGVKQGKARAGEAGALVEGVGLYVYKETEPVEWTLYREHWLGEKAE